MEESSQESGISQTNNENTHNSSQAIENSTRFETISIKSSKSNTNVSTSSETQINISDTTPLRTTKLQEVAEYVELEFNNGGNNIRCYTEEEEVPELPNDLVVGDDNSSSSKKRGLSSDQALEKLVEVASEILEGHQNHFPISTCIKEYLISPDSVLTILSSNLLIAFYIFGTLKSELYQIHLTTILIEAILILVIFILNGFIYTREKKLGMNEINKRAQNILDQLKQSRMDTIQDIKIPIVPSLTVAKVIRDGIVRIFPTTLLVEGDVVEMLYGDVAPCKMKLIQQESSNNNILESGQLFKPSFFSDMTSKEVYEQHIQNKGRYQFVLLETPWANSLKSALNQERPDTVIYKQAKVLQNIFLYRILFIILALAIIINLLRYKISGNENSDQLFEILVVLPIYAILPIIPLAFPLLWLIVRSFANATLLVLFETLQISKTEYEDDEEVDEFDAEAPPPTKNVHLDTGALWNKFRYLLTKLDGSSLARSTNLFESLGSTTVICSIDREGTISSPFASVEQIIFPNESEDIAVLDIAEDPSTSFGVQFEDQDWDQHLSRLKPLGLNLLLNTNCGVLKGKKRAEQHRKSSSLHIRAKTKPARQSCLCRLGKEIGFTDDALKAFAKRKEIFTVTPCHPSLKQRIRNDQWEMPIMNSSIYEEVEQGSFQLLSDGNIEIILDNCSDYWNGQGLHVMSEVIMNKIYDFYENSIINDMQCIAYAYRPINVENENKIPFLLDSPNDSSEICIILPSSPESDQISISEDDDLSLSQKVRLERLKAGQLEANLHDFSFDGSTPTNKEKERFYQEVIQGQIFLAMATFCHQPKLDVCNFIEDLNSAGIRFVYFSPTDERESKAYAERLGLETDWNSCILLSSPGDENSFGDGYLESHDIKARLPRGIDKIRDHLREVDDIPLHVSLFAECTPEATREMIKIFQEYGEVVCCIGSALNASNTHTFAVADVSVAMEPTHTRAQTKNGVCHYNGNNGKGQSPMALGAAFTTLPCGLFMHYDTSLYALTDVIREARRLINCLKMGVAFILGCYLSISLLLLFSYILFLPPAFTGYQILWVTWIISPILAFSFLFNPHEPDTMTTMTVKNIEHLKDFKRFVLYWFLRFILPILTCLLVFLGCLYYLDDNRDSNLIFGFHEKNTWLRWTNKQQWIVIYSQNCTLFIFVWYMIILSSTFIHRTLSLKRFIPFKNRVWIFAIIISLLLQIIFTTISLVLGPLSLLKNLPYYIYLIGFLSPILFIPIQELVKMHDKKEYNRFQKRSKLEFNTKLGMHSPV
ncbi:calcium ATPase [Rhizophagus irregularis]|uniref:Calcium ATPase n=1 Tax=Rhizophagus irregularis TaxID=588596 RepID=A0A2N1NRD3_9GLOM|nr:calcium ATPase [Rhizophagus irregularis]